MIVDTDVRDRLSAAARDAAEDAYVPYSDFPVGAAVLAAGKIYAAANVENASYGLSLCAERAALAKAVSEGAAGKIQAIAVACVNAGKEAGESELLPCGACRQWMQELAPRLVIYIVAFDEDILEVSLPELLPRPFKLRAPTQS